MIRPLLIVRHNGLADQAAFFSSPLHCESQARSQPAEHNPGIESFGSKMGPPCCRFPYLILNIQMWVKSQESKIKKNHLMSKNPAKLQIQL